MIFQNVRSFFRELSFPVSGVAAASVGFRVHHAGDVPLSLLLAVLLYGMAARMDSELEFHLSRERGTGDVGDLRKTWNLSRLHNLRALSFAGFLALSGLAGMSAFLPAMIAYLFWRIAVDRRVMSQVMVVGKLIFIFFSGAGLYGTGAYWGTSPGALLGVTGVAISLFHVGIHLNVLVINRSRRRNEGSLAPAHRYSSGAFRVLAYVCVGTGAAWVGGCLFFLGHVVSGVASASIGLLILLIGPVTPQKVSPDILQMCVVIETLIVAMV